MVIKMFAQSINCCSANPDHFVQSFFWARHVCASRQPLVENVQHDPQCPWSLIGVMIPLVLQSILISVSLAYTKLLLPSSFFFCCKLVLVVVAEQSCESIK